MENTTAVTKRIIYIHGFLSDAGSSKPAKIQKLLPDYKIIADSFSPNPHKAIEHLKELFEEANTEVIFMGTSLGGFYAMFMAAKLGVECICINPSILSHQTLLNKIGEYKTYNLNLEYKFKPEYIDALKDMHDQLFERLDKIEYKPTVVFNDDDDVIHHSLFENYKKYFNARYYPSGGHRATNIEEIIKGLEL